MTARAREASAAQPRRGIEPELWRSPTGVAADPPQMRGKRFLSERSAASGLRHETLGSGLFVARLLGSHRRDLLEL